MLLLASVRRDLGDILDEWVTIDAAGLVVCLIAVVDGLTAGRGDAIRVDSRLNVDRGNKIGSCALTNNEVVLTHTLDSAESVS